MLTVNSKKGELMNKKLLRYLFASALTLSLTSNSCQAMQALLPWNWGSGNTQQDADEDMRNVNFGNNESYKIISSGTNNLRHKISFWNQGKQYGKVLTIDQRKIIGNCLYQNPTNPTIFALLLGYKSSWNTRKRSKGFQKITVCIYNAQNGKTSYKNGISNRAKNLQWSQGGTQLQVTRPTRNAPQVLQTIKLYK